MRKHGAIFSALWRIDCRRILPRQALRRDILHPDGLAPQIQGSSSGAHWLPLRAKSSAQARRGQRGTSSFTPASSQEELSRLFRASVRTLVQRNPLATVHAGATSASASLADTTEHDAAVVINASLMAQLGVAQLSEQLAHTVTGSDGVHLNEGAALDRALSLGLQAGLSPSSVLRRIQDALHHESGSSCRDSGDVDGLLEGLLHRCLTEELAAKILQAESAHLRRFHQREDRGRRPSSSSSSSSPTTVQSNRAAQSNWVLMTILSVVLRPQVEKMPSSSATCQRCWPHALSMSLKLCTTLGKGSLAEGILHRAWGMWASPVGHVAEQDLRRLRAQMLELCYDAAMAVVEEGGSALPPSLRPSLAIAQEATIFLRVRAIVMSYFFGLQSTTSMPRPGGRTPSASPPVSEEVEADRAAMALHADLNEEESAVPMPTAEAAGGVDDALLDAALAAGTTSALMRLLTPLALAVGGKVEDYQSVANLLTSLVQRTDLAYDGANAAAATSAVAALCDVVGRITILGGATRLSTLEKLYTTVQLNAPAAVLHHQPSVLAAVTRALATAKQSAEASIVFNQLLSPAMRKDYAFDPRVMTAMLLASTNATDNMLRYLSFKAQRYTIPAASLQALAADLLLYATAVAYNAPTAASEESGRMEVEAALFHVLDAAAAASDAGVCADDVERTFFLRCLSLYSLLCQRCASFGGDGAPHQVDWANTLHVVQQWVKALSPALQHDVRHRHGGELSASAAVTVQLLDALVRALDSDLAGEATTHSARMELQQLLKATSMRVGVAVIDPCRALLVGRVHHSPDEANKNQIMAPEEEEMAEPTSLTPVWPTSHDYFGDVMDVIASVERGEKDDAAKLLTRCQVVSQRLGGDAAKDDALPLVNYVQLTTLHCLVERYVAAARPSSITAEVVGDVPPSAASRDEVLQHLHEFLGQSRHRLTTTKVQAGVRGVPAENTSTPSSSPRDTHHEWLAAWIGCHVGFAAVQSRAVALAPVVTPSTRPSRGTRIFGQAWTEQLLPVLRRGGNEDEGEHHTRSFPVHAHFRDLFSASPSVHKTVPA